MAVAIGAEGVEQEDGHDHQPVRRRYRADDPLAGFGVAGKVACFQQLIHGILDGAHPHKGVDAAGHQNQQQADRSCIKNIGVNEHHGGKQRHSGQDAQYSAQGVGAVVPGGKSIPPFLHQTGHAVLGVDGLFFQKFVRLNGRAALHEKNDSYSNKHQQDGQPKAGGSSLAEGEQAVG